MNLLQLLLFVYFPLFSSRRYRSIGSGKSGANREGGGLWVDVGIRGEEVSRESWRNIGDVGGRGGAPGKTSFYPGQI